MVEIKDSDLEVQFFRGGGPGGQHRNVTDSGVRIRHIPTGIVVIACERRSQAQNRRLAMERLHEALKRLQRVRRKRKPTTVPTGERKKRLASKKMAKIRRENRSVTGSDCPE